MRSYSITCLALMFAGALACDSKGDGTSDTSEFGTDGSSSSDGSSSDGVSSTDGTGGPMTSGGSSNTSVSTSASTSASSDTETTGGTTTGYDPTDTTTDPTITSTGTSMTSVGSDTATTGEWPPVEPKPCEGEAVELDVAAIAYLQAQQPPMPDPTGGSSGGGTDGGDPLDPDTVFVRLSNKVATCADPNPYLECGSNWEVSIAIPPSYQTPGLYHLFGPEVIGHQFETGADEGGGECSGGGGSFDATFELIAIDDDTVTGRLCHVNSNFFDVQVDLEGSFSAPRCP